MSGPAQSSPAGGHPPVSRSGFAAVIGRPNVGKSTLVNHLVGRKIAIVSDKPQTTRNRILGAVWGPGYQLVLIDTPGIHKPHHLLGEAMVATAVGALAETEAALMVVEAQLPPGPGDQHVAAYLRERSTPAFCVLNKADLVASEAELAASARRYGALAPFRAVQAVSALTGDGLPELLAAVQAVLPAGPEYFPRGTVTDQPERFIVGELVREKLVVLTEDEIPHSLAIEVQEMAKRDTGILYIRCVIYVERASQRGIVLGAGGGKLKQAGTMARDELERLLGERIYLDLWVKVKPDWRNRQRDLRELGYR
jgi:GTP-binding protein Era